MKDGVREGLHIKCKKEEKEFFTREEERKFWETNLLGTSAVKSLLYTVYFWKNLWFNAAFHIRELSRIVVFTL